MHRPVALVAGVFVHLILGRPHVLHGGPRRGEGFGIVHRVLVAQRVRVDARKALGEDHVRPRAAEAGVRREVRRLHHQRVAFPASARVALPKAHAAWQMVAVVGGNHAVVVHHLVQDGHVAGRLDDAHDVVVGARAHGRAGVEADQAARCRRAVGRRERATLPRLPVLRHAHPRFRGVFRHPPIGGIDDERRAPGAGDRRADVQKDEVVADVHVALARLVRRGSFRRALVPFGDAVLPRFDLLVSEELLVRELLWSLHRRRGAEIPRALQIGNAPGGLRRRFDAGGGVSVGCRRVFASQGRRGGQQHGRGDGPAVAGKLRLRWRHGEPPRSVAPSGYRWP